MVEKIIVFYKAISFIFMNFFMGIVYTLFPIYVAICYKNALKARGIVYGYWISSGNNRLYTMLSSNACSIKSWKKVEVDGIKVIQIEANAMNDYEYVYYIKDYNQMFTKDSNIFVKCYNYIRYLFWYYIVWIWLDDDNNINGLDLRIFKPNSRLYDRLKNETAIYITSGAKVYAKVFDLPYIEDPRVLKLDKIMYSVYNQEINNYQRDKGSYKYYRTVMLMGIGFKINPYYFRSTINVFGYDLLKNKDGI